MKSRLLFQLTETHSLYNPLLVALDAQPGDAIIRYFPDQETYIRILSEVKDCDVYLLCSLNQPNKKLIPLILFTETLRQLGASRVNLLCPYLAYMRQDTVFHPGEGVSAKYIATLFSQTFDSLITIDPHLHRYHHLDEIYTIPTTTLHATIPIAHWIAKHIQHPIIIGPDKESEQWVAEIARHIQQPYLVLEKTRLGDKMVSTSLPHLDNYQGCQPVLVDDIISTAHTMIETVNHLAASQSEPITCIGVHAIFAEDAYEKLRNSPTQKIVTCNTIMHPTNEIDVSVLFASHQIYD